MAETSSIIPVISVIAVIFFGVVGVIWNVYTKASASKESALNQIHEKIDSRVAVCNSVHQNLQGQIDQVKTMMLDHKMETINRTEANSLIEEKIRPIKESLDKVEKCTNKLDDKLSELIESIATIKGFIMSQHNNSQNKRKDDIK